MAFYRETKAASEAMKLKRNKADNCLFYKWVNGYLVLMLVWVDDYLILGPPKIAQKLREEVNQLFECTDTGEMKEYVGCKVERELGWCRLTQPVKMQRCIDEYGLDMSKKAP